MSKGYGSWYVSEVCVCVWCACVHARVCDVRVCVCVREEVCVCVKWCAYKCTLCCMKVDREIFTLEIICVKKICVV